MSAKTGHTSNVGRTGRPAAPLHASGQGGHPRTMILGMAGVALGLYGFWRLQFMKQNRSHSSLNPAEMPTWQFRHAQQVPEFNDRMSAPGGSSATPRARTSSSPESVGATFSHAKPTNSGPTDGGKHESESAPQPAAEKAHPVRNIVASVMTSLHGDGQGDDVKGRIEQPAAPRRMNDRGGMYTKNSDYKDSYRRD